MDAGIYLGNWLSGLVKGNIPDIFSARDSSNFSDPTIETFSLSGYNYPYAFNKKRDQKFETGYSIGIDLLYNLNERRRLQFSFVFFQSLTDQQKKYFIHQVPRYNQTYVIQVGYTLVAHAHDKHRI